MGVRRNATSEFNIGDHLGGNVTARQLELAGQLVLCPIPLVAESDHVRSDDVEPKHDEYGFRITGQTAEHPVGHSAAIQLMKRSDSDSLPLRLLLGL